MLVLHQGKGAGGRDREGGDVVFVEIVASVIEGDP
jgi:hypothetical protein